jgi:hypothetical protein
MACAAGWLASCSAYFFLERRGLERTVAITGALVALTLVAMKMLPFFPGHFSRNEWISLGVWAVLGLILQRRPQPAARAAAPLVP